MTNLHAELIIRNGTIRTMDPLHPTAEAVAIANGRILAVGSLEDVESTAHANTRRIDLGGRTLIPGFNDAYVHLGRVGLLLTSILDVRSPMLSNIPAIVEALKARASQIPAGNWLSAHGYNNVTLQERCHPTRVDLDRASMVHPIVLTHASGHSIVVNSCALELAGIRAATSDPLGGTIERDERGEPTGILHETAVAAIGKVQPLPTHAEFEAAVLAAAKMFLRLGITSVTDANVKPAELDVYRRLAGENRMPFRISAIARRYLDNGTKIPLPERYDGRWLHIDTVKLQADGGLVSGNAALSDPYFHDTKHKGPLRTSDEQLRAMIWDIHRAGLRASIHATGDLAIGQVIDAIEYASGRLASRMKHRIEHFSLPTAAHLQHCRGRINIVAQPIFIHSLGSTFRHYLSPYVLSNLYPLRAILDAGVTIALGSDAPVVLDANPLLGIKAAANRTGADGIPLGSEQSITVAEALPLYTLGGAIVAGEEHLKGSITPGHVADLAILSGDPLRAPVERLTELRVEMTIVDGHIMYTG